MSETDEFWQYAREAMLSVGYAKTDEEKRDLMELAKRHCKGEHLL